MNNLKEIWLPLHGFKGCDILSEKYRVSNYGKIYNILDHRFMKLSLCGEPKYHYVTLTHKNVRKTLRVHRLVAMSFIPNLNGLPIVDHIDRDRLNNYVGNLRWVTKSFNGKNSDRSDNIGNNSNPKQSRVKFKGVGENNSVICKGRYYGRCEDKEIAAKIYDVIARHEFTNPYLNFPDIQFCSYDEIHKYIYRRKELRICQELEDRVIYKWKYEYITQADLSRAYNIPLHKISEILKGMPKKERKPVWKISKDYVRRLYLRDIIREKYLGGMTPTQISNEIGETKKFVDVFVKDLPNLFKKKTLCIEIKKEIYKKYLDGTRQCDLVKEYNVERYVIANIRRKFKGMSMEEVNLRF